MQLDGDSTWNMVLLLATARVGGVFLFAPVYSAQAVPWRLRILMSLALGVAFSPLVAATSVMPTTTVGLIAALACELAVGATIGYAAAVVLSGVQLGAFHIAQQMGLSLAENFRAATDDGRSAGVLRRFFYLLAIVIFLSVGGHREIIGALRRTFQVIPVAGFAATTGLLQMIVVLLATSFMLALKIAAPVLITMLMVTAALGAVQRTLPQYNTLTVGLSVRMLVGLVVLAAMLVVFSALVEQATSLTFGQIERWLAVQ